MHYWVLFCPDVASQTETTSYQVVKSTNILTLNVTTIYGFPGSMCMHVHLILHPELGDLTLLFFTNHN